MLLSFFKEFDTINYLLIFAMLQYFEFYTSDIKRYQRISS